MRILCCAIYHLPHEFDDSESDATPQKKPKVEKGQRFLTGFKGFEKYSARNESASVGISEDSDHLQSESIPSPPPQALSEGDAPATAEKPKVEQETTRTIVDAWFKPFPWLTYDKEEKVIRCTVCMEDKIVKNSFTRGCSNFGKSALTEHVATLDHKSALKTPVNRSNQEEVTKIVLTKEENGIVQAVKAVHWIVSETKERKAEYIGRIVQKWGQKKNRGRLFTEQFSRCILVLFQVNEEEDFRRDIDIDDLMSTFC